MRLGILTFILLLLLSCSRYPSEVESALQQAGANRDSLVAVLEHYRDGDDPMKYEAACFLIANMPYHGSSHRLEVPVQYGAYFAQVDSILEANADAVRDNDMKRELAVQYGRLPDVQTLGGCADLQSVAASYLITCIDEAFERWEKSPLLAPLGFDEFKEYVLPYRTVAEPLPPMKSELRREMYGLMSADGMEKIRKPIERYKQRAIAQKEMNRYVEAQAHAGIYDIYLPLFVADCSNLSATTCNIFRACGIPAVFEFTPQWTDRSNRHFWCASPDEAGRFHPYTPPYNNLDEDWTINLRYAGKVYRATFGAQENTPYFIKRESEVVPEIFATPCLMDVTDNYHECADVELPLPPRSAVGNIAYLAYFNVHNGLNPVAWGVVDDWTHTVKYEKVPLNMLFFPVYMRQDGSLEAFYPPFVVRGEDCEYVVDTMSCNHAMPVSMHLLRKFPHKPHLVKYRENLKGAMVLASNRERGAYDTLFAIPDAPQPCWQRYTFANKRTYRYYKIVTADGSPIEIAEYEWLSDRQDSRGSKPSQLPVFNARAAADSGKYVKVMGKALESGPLFRYSVDGDFDTYVESPWVGMRFASPVCITGLQIYPRNARNGIEPGNTYQLLFHDGKRWVVHSTVNPMANYIDVQGVPSGTVYLLRNLSSGKEELPFFYIDGKQVFLSDMALQGQ